MLDFCDVCVCGVDSLERVTQLCHVFLRPHLEYRRARQIHDVNRSVVCCDLRPRILWNGNKVRGREKFGRKMGQMWTTPSGTHLSLKYGARPTASSAVPAPWRPRLPRFPLPSLPESLASVFWVLRQGFFGRRMRELVFRMEIRNG